MSSCSYKLLKSEFDNLKQNDPEFQKLLAIYEPGKPKNKSEYGFIMDMLTLQSATKNDKMMRKKSRIAAQYNGTYTKNESIADRLAGVEDLIDEMEKAGCGYGLRDYYNQQKAKQQPTTQKASQPTANVKTKDIMTCMMDAIELLRKNKGIHLSLLQCERSQIPFQGVVAQVYAPYMTGRFKVDIAYFPASPLPQCNLSLEFEAGLVETPSVIDPILNLNKTTFTQEEKQTLRFTFIFNEIIKRLQGKHDRVPEVSLSTKYMVF